MSKKETQTCWEFWKCEIKFKKKCPAYKTKSGKDCWNVVGSYKKYPICLKLKEKFKACWECPWFKKLNPNFNKG